MPVSTDLHVPVTAVYGLEHRLAESEARKNEAINRAALAETRLKEWRKDISKSLRDAAGQIATARGRRECAMVLRAIARRAELERELHQFLGRI